MEWVVKKKKAFEQRGDMAVSVWAEQQQREMNLKARRLSQQKVRISVPVVQLVYGPSDTQIASFCESLLTKKSAMFLRQSLLILHLALS
jgi:hypothetical protein